MVTWHTRVSAEGARSHVVRLMERQAARAAAVVLGASSDLVDQARLRGARDARLAPVALPAPRYALDEDELLRNKARAELGAVARPLLVTVGRLEPGQGYGPLLDAARVWRELDPEPLLVVAGEGRERPEMQRRIEDEGLPVQLVGRRDDVPELLAAADVVILASRWEARSWLAQEALHAGVPLVATSVGGVPDLVGGRRPSSSPMAMRPRSPMRWHACWRTPSAGPNSPRRAAARRRAGPRRTTRSPTS
ncbi:hypothetical protein GCM10020000_63190 [Streptomyces olivoverticillatus]